MRFTLNVTSFNASFPATSASASSSSLTVTVKPGRYTTRVCAWNLLDGTCFAMT